MEATETKHYAELGCSQRIARGFDYDGHHFSNSLAAQSNWAALLYSSRGSEILTCSDGTYTLHHDNYQSFYEASRKSIYDAIQECRDKIDGKLNLDGSPIEV